MANETRAVKSAASGAPRVPAGPRPPPRRVGALGLVYGVGTWLQFLLLGRWYFRFCC
jgi:hypothetical protein